jgi:hypothetical protein
LGIDPASTINDRQGQPRPIVPEGEILADVLA